jgi:cysteine dioxygenase
MISYNMNLRNLFSIISDGLKNGNTLKSYSDFISSYDNDDWKQYVGKIEITPGLTYMRKIIYTNKNLDFYIIVWPPGSESGIHDHAAGGCILKILEGSLEETTFSPNFEAKEVNQLFTNQHSIMTNKIGYHNIRNISNSMSASLHIYSPGGHKTTYFNR